LGHLSVRRFRQLVTALEERRDLGVVEGAVAESQNHCCGVVEEVHTITSRVVDDETVRHLDHLYVLDLGGTVAHRAR
jgi:hypothetical protein